MTQPTEAEARDILEEQVSRYAEEHECNIPIMANPWEAMDFYAAAVRRAVVEEIVGMVEAESRTLLRDADDAALDRLAFANRLIDTIRGLAAPTTEEG